MTKIIIIVKVIILVDGQTSLIHDVFDFDYGLSIVS